MLAQAVGKTQLAQEQVRGSLREGLKGSERCTTECAHAVWWQVIKKLLDGLGALNIPADIEQAMTSSNTSVRSSAAARARLLALSGACCHWRRCAGQVKRVLGERFVLEVELHQRDAHDAFLKQVGATDGSRWRALYHHCAVSRSDGLRTD